MPSAVPPSAGDGCCPVRACGRDRGAPPPPHGHGDTSASAPRRIVPLLSVVLVALVACGAAQGNDAAAPADGATASDADDEPQRPLPPPRDADRSEARRGPQRPRPTIAPDSRASRRAELVETWRDDLDDDAALLGQLLMLRVYGGGIDEPDPRNKALYGVATPREIIETFRPGGVVLFRTDDEGETGNLQRPRQIRTFTDDLREASQALGPPVTVATDQEGGRVDRIGHLGTDYPAARELAGDTRAAARQAETTVTELTALGIDMNFAPVADVDSEPSNPVIGDRAYSSDPEVVADMVLAELDVYRNRGVVPVLKHFPGHGDTTGDSHHTLPTVDADLDLLARRELVPFVRAVDAGAAAIMTAHLRLPRVSGGESTSMSTEVVTELLREKLDFDGLIVTDALEMAGARHDRADDRVALDALLAGHDLLVLPPVPQQSLAVLGRALDGDQLTQPRVEASIDRVLHLKATLAEASARPNPTVVGDAGS